jgi:alginate O-acetyltransferase complex protein AlgJ
MGQEGELTEKSRVAFADRQDAQAQERPSPLKVVRGKDGWLFLDFDTNRVMAQVQGRLRLSAEELRQWQFLLENRVAWLARRRALYLFLVPPLPHAVFADKLPDGCFEAERPVLQLLRHLESQRSYARVLYPVEELIEHRDSHYTKTDTHWTDRGAFIAYSLLSDEIESFVPMRRLDDTDIDWIEVMKAGDLGDKLQPEEQSLHVYAQPSNPQARLVYDNGIFHQGRRADFECDTAPDSTCLVLGTSSAFGMVHLFAEGFRRLVFANIPTLDYALVNEVNPDVVIAIFGERFMIRVPVDLLAPTQPELEAEKRAARKVLFAPEGLLPPDGHWRTRLL